MLAINHMSFMTRILQYYVFFPFCAKNCINKLIHCRLKILLVRKCAFQEPFLANVLESDYRLDIISILTFPWRNWQMTFAWANVFASISTLLFFPALHQHCIFRCGNEPLYHYDWYCSGSGHGNFISQGKYLDEDHIYVVMNDFFKNFSLGFADLMCLVYNFDNRTSVLCANVTRIYLRNNV